MEAAANAMMEPPSPPPPAPAESGYVTSTVSSVLFQFVGIFFLMLLQQPELVLVLIGGLCGWIYSLWVRLIRAIISFFGGAVSFRAPPPTRQFVPLPAQPYVLHSKVARFQGRFDRLIAATAAARESARRGGVPDLQ